jgi:hypothetical protein
MATKTHPRPAAREGLREAVRAHDMAAIEHMRSARKHLRHSQSLTRQIEHNEQDKR